MRLEIKVVGFEQLYGLIDQAIVQDHGAKDGALALRAVWKGFFE
ncbi:MAG: hypothetical protein WKF84_04510 [Pyrinomonadaceae bacterium]